MRLFYPVARNTASPNSGLYQNSRVGMVVLGIVLLNVIKWCQFPTRYLLVGIDPFPIGWRVSDDGPERVSSAPLGGRGSIQSIEVSYHLPEVAGASEQIYLFQSTREASRYLARRVDHTFRQTELDDPWVVPEELAYQSSKADYSYWACDLSTSVTPMQGCTYVAQYGAYVVLFGIDWIPGHSVSWVDLERILRAIDDKMAFWGW